MTGFIDAMQSAGISPPPDIIPDGNLHRFHVESDKPHSENGWYVLHDDPPAGAFGSWKMGVQEAWSSKSHTTLTPTEKARYRANMEAQKQQRRAEQVKIHTKCQEKSKAIWEQAKPAPEEHPYLIKKNVKVYGLREFNGSLLVPVRDVNILHGLQFINTDGSKKFKTGTNKTGHYYPIGGKPESVLYLSEGYATAATIHEATGQPVAVCFDSGNLKPVAEVLRVRLPDIQLIICADNDRDKKENIGLTKATEAAGVIGCLLAVPEFSTNSTGTDFNDLAAEVGIDEARRQIEAAHSPEVLLVKESSNQWEDPLFFGEIDTPEITPDKLPCWLGDYVAAVSASTQTPPGLAVMLALSVVATCLQKRFTISPQGNDYSEPLNLWTVTALPPASRKSAVTKAITTPLDVWEKEQADKMADSIRRTNIKRAMNLKRIEKLTKQAADINDPHEREAMLCNIAETEKDTPEEQRPPRLWTGDVTPERLQGLLVEHGERMALLSDEGGIFEIMAGLYNDGKVNIDVFLQAHAGQGMRVERSSRTAYLEAPALTFGLAIQPAVIADFSQGSKKRFRGNGALARFLYCLPRNNIGQRDVRRYTPIPESVKARYHAGIDDLLNIEPLIDAAGTEQPRTLTLSAEALDSWLSFAQFIESNQGTNGEFEPIQDWTGKLPGAALRIAGLLHVVEFGGASPIVNQATMEKALDLAELLIEHAKAAFDLMGSDQATDDAKAVLCWIQKEQGSTFKRSECHHTLKGRFTKIERLTKALDVLHGREIISKPIKESTGGRPSIIYEVNPAVVSGGGLDAVA